MRDFMAGAFLILAGAAAGAGGSRALEDPRVEAPELGSPAAAVVAAEGAPEKISWGPDVQIWHYRNPAGSLQGRYWIQQGMVVEIRR